jgi:RNA polymerase sigma-70 factor (ECF subfamily)
MVDLGPWTVTDEVSLVACYDQSVAHVYRYASRLTGNDRARTDDLVQDVYLGLVRVARDGTLHTVGMGWLYTSVRHRFLDGIRGAAREERRLQLVRTLPNGQASEVREVCGLADLPDRERVAMVLRYLDDLPVADVAAEMGLTVHATESLLARARRRMRAQEVRDA